MRRTWKPSNRASSTALERSEADLAIYLAGADPFIYDRLGRLRVTKDGLAERDRLVFASCRAAGLPVAVTMAGGYAEEVDDTVEIHYRTVVEAIASAEGGRSPLTGGI